MHRYPFIFSNAKSYRLRRHLLFWASWWVFQSFLYSFSGPAMQVSYLQRLPLSALEAIVYLVPHLFLAYSLMYFVVPRFLLRGRYVASLVITIFLFLATAGISALIAVYLINDIRYLVLGGAYKPPTHVNELNLFLSLLAGLRGSITIGGLAAAIKLMKHLYQKEERNLQLQKQNVEVQLQLLKAQVHPHFLFNTLNNIYSYTQSAAPVAARLVAGLSDMLRYMLYEGSQPLVPLHKELKMLQDYILLEQVRYDHQLDINLDLPAQTDGWQIAPLLLLPLVENSFKHGASRMLEQPWISLHISIEGNYLDLKLVNGKAQETETNRHNTGIGIINVRKRLELLYPQKHSLKITPAEDVFVVDLKLVLDKSNTLVETALSTQKPALHA
jgi:sensor histidine kinase YesM